VRQFVQRKDNRNKREKAVGKSWVLCPRGVYKWAGTWELVNRLLKYVGKKKKKDKRLFWKCFLW